jgi:hypothetical protein
VLLLLLVLTPFFSFLFKAQLGPLEKNCHGALVGLDTSQPAVRRLLAAWLDCALHVECIAPQGAHRGNHRQDQAALTLLVLMSKERLGADFSSSCSSRSLHDLPLGGVIGGKSRGLDASQVQVRAGEDAANWPKLASQYYQCRTKPVVAA